ncbi:hypothetical protein AB0M28_02610 [Streptomyces sp. NPDC051940]|uniref:hypothetical protein n=1 Tax=Streptomyces sp. NPDC051940 TaxID=3155675 RepID=UPI00343D9C5A
MSTAVDESVSTPSVPEARGTEGTEGAVTAPGLDGGEWVEPVAEEGPEAGDAGTGTEADAEADVDSVVSEAVARDAKDFGVYAKTGGWTFALKVARSVRPGGTPVGEEGGKVSAKAFARLAGCSPERVMRFWRAWDAAADDGRVPVFEALEPGTDVDLPDADVWVTYYTSRSSGSSPRGHAIAAVAEAEGIRPTKALEVAENPTALRAAILADPATAQAARHALMDRLEDDPSLAAELARDIAQAGELKKAVAAEAKVADRLDFVRQVVETGEVKTPSGQKIPAPEPVLEEARQHLALMEDLADEEVGGYAADAYGALQTLVVEAVESDPQLRAHERRARFQAKVQKAAKAFEELTLDDAAAVYEEEMLQQLEKLQASIAACIAELRRAASEDAPEDAPEDDA